MEHDFKLIAPHINRLLGCYEGFQNPVQPGAELMTALDPLFKVMADLAPYKKNDEAKGIWITVPRGEITDWGNFEEEKKAGEVDSYEEFEEIWLDYYPNETEWYYVGISENKPDSRCKFRGLSVASRNRHHLVINADLKEGVREQTWYNEEPAIELCKLILPAVEHSMAMLREGTYNKMVEEHLPYQHRTGVIPRKVEWKYYPSAKENVFEGLSDSAFLAFKSFIAENDSDHIGRMKSFTANDFFRACAIGYAACGYETDGSSPSELYLRYADGRDEGGKHGENQKGLVTFDRMLRKDAFYLYKAAWNKKEPFVHLCGKRYINRCEEETEIKVYSNQPHVKLYVDGAFVGEQDGKTVFRFRIPLMGEHLIEAFADGAHDSMCIRRVSEPDESYIFNKAAASVTNWFDSDDIDPTCFSIMDTLGEIRQHPQAGAIVNQMMAKGASERGDVADAVKDNPALQRMMGRMTMMSLLKQGGADEESIKQLNRILQGIKK